MSLHLNRAHNLETSLHTATTSIATTPVAAHVTSPVDGVLARVGAAAAGTTTGGPITVTVALNGVTVTTALSIADGSGVRAGTVVELPIVGPNFTNVLEGDCLTFTPSGGTGASIPGSFFAVIRR